MNARQVRLGERVRDVDDLGAGHGVADRRVVDRPRIVALERLAAPSRGARPGAPCPSSPTSEMPSCVPENRRWQLSRILSNTGARPPSTADDLQHVGGGGLLLQRLLGLVEQPRVLDRDHRLVGEGLEQRDLRRGERPGARRDDGDRADAAAFPASAAHQRCGAAAQPLRGQRMPAARPDRWTSRTRADRASRTPRRASIARAAIEVDRAQRRLDRRESRRVACRALIAAQRSRCSLPSSTRHELERVGRRTAARSSRGSVEHRRDRPPSR